MAAINMRFGHFRPLDCTFSYDNGTPLLYSIKNPFFWYLTCICVMKTHDSRQNGEKMADKICAFRLVEEHMESRGNFNVEKPCHISLKS